MDNIIHAFNFRRFRQHSRLIVVIDFHRLSRSIKDDEPSTNDENESVNRAAFRIHFIFLLSTIRNWGVSFSLVLSRSATYDIPISLRILVFTIIRYSSCHLVDLFL